MCLREMVIQTLWWIWLDMTNVFLLFRQPKVWSIFNTCFPIYEKEIMLFSKVLLSADLRSNNRTCSLNKWMTSMASMKTLKTSIILLVDIFYLLHAVQQTGCNGITSCWRLLDLFCSFGKYRHRKIFLEQKWNLTVKNVWITVKKQSGSAGAPAKGSILF